MLLADAPPPAYVSTAVKYPDGAVAEARPECGVLDLCATITLPDQEVLRIYNKGSGRCGPFVLHVVRMHDNAVVLDSDLVTATTKTAAAYSQTDAPQPASTATSAPRFELNPHQACAEFKNTYFTFDGGQIRMGVFLAKDGSLFMQFYPPK
jgi:hypothetical protein